MRTITCIIVDDEPQARKLMEAYVSQLSGWKIVRLCCNAIEAFESLQFLGEFQAQAHGHPNGKIVKMTCYMADYTGELKPDSEIEEIKWLTYSDKDQISHVDKLIFDFLKEKDLIS